MTIIDNALNKSSYRVHKYRVLHLIFYATIINIMIEMLSRKSLAGLLVFLTEKPIMFLLNIGIIMLTLSLSYLFVRRRYSFICLSFMWIGLGIANGIILCFRLTPISAMDLYDITSIIDRIPQYLNVFQMILICALILIIVSGLVFLWKRSKKDKIPFASSLPIILFIGLFIISLSFIASKTKALSNQFDNLHDAYKDYGFAYCFTNSLFDRGIDRPYGYSEAKIEELLEEVESKLVQINSVGESNIHNGIEEPPNIIMVQLESFMDINSLKNYEFSENPVPFFTKLKEEFTSGFLTVPVYGAGTVNTEFEVITGMNSKFFGKGEYPYRTILTSTTSESICYNLSKLGYHNYVIHNNTASFYKRNDVFKMLGFDNFVSVEYMNHVELNSIGWPKDKVLTQEILKALKAKDTKDFIYTITVQDHGIYPDVNYEEEKKIKVKIKQENTLQLKDNKSEEGYLNQLEYYVNQINETDEFINELTQALNEFEEPTIVVFYGDHLPPLSFENDDLENDRYETEYVMWSNFTMEKERHDLTTYQLNAYVLERLGIPGGIISGFHQTQDTDANYEKQLKLLQYDMLYGKKYVYHGINPYPVKNLKMGIYDQKITGVEIKENKIFVIGENFTNWSKIYMNNEQKETTFVNNNTLWMTYEEIDDKEIYIVQVTNDNKKLSKSAPWK